MRTAVAERRQIAILFARQDSVYKDFPDCDVWDIDRDARLWPGGSPIVAHPPCAQWSRLYRFARVDEAEKALAPWAIAQVRKFGGVLEHPYKSRLWKELSLPLGNKRDEYGGFTVAMPQWWFGHPANKATWFYICGVDPAQLPPVPLKLGTPDKCVSPSVGQRGLKEMKKTERTRTHLAMAEWLVSTARLCSTPQIAQR